MPSDVRGVHSTQLEQLQVPAPHRTCARARAEGGSRQHGHQWTEKRAKQLGVVVGAYVAFVDRDCSRGYSIGKVLQLAPAVGGIFQNLVNGWTRRWRPPAGC